MEDSSTLKQDQFFLTGSDFSDLAQLENNLNDLSSMREATSHDLKMAKFKKIDWNIIEAKLMKGPNKINVRKETQKGNHFRNRKGQSHDLGR